MNDTSKKNRYVVCAAVRTSDGIVHVGRRHSNCFTLIGALGGVRYHDGSIQGFVDNDWSFLTRSEAFKVAKAAGQILDEKAIVVEKRGILYSEDIY